MNDSFLLQNFLDCFTQLTDNKGVSSSFDELVKSPYCSLNDHFGTF